MGSLSIFNVALILLALLLMSMTLPSLAFKQHFDTTDPGFEEPLIDSPGTDYALWSRLSRNEKLLYIKAFTEGVGIQALQPDFFEVARRNGDTLPEVLDRLEGGYGSNRRNERAISVPWAMLLAQMRVEGRSPEEAEHILNLIRGVLHPDEKD